MVVCIRIVHALHTHKNQRCHFNEPCEAVQERIKTVRETNFIVHDDSTQLNEELPKMIGLDDTTLK